MPGLEARCLAQTATRGRVIGRGPVTVTGTQTGPGIGAGTATGKGRQTATGAGTVLEGAMESTGRDEAALKEAGRARGRGPGALTAAADGGETVATRRRPVSGLSNRGPGSRPRLVSTDETEGFVGVQDAAETQAGAATGGERASAAAQAGNEAGGAPVEVAAGVKVGVEVATGGRATTVSVAAGVGDAVGAEHVAEVAHVARTHLRPHVATADIMAAVLVPTVPAVEVAGTGTVPENATPLQARVVAVGGGTGSGRGRENGSVGVGDDSAVDDTPASSSLLWRRGQILKHTTHSLANDTGDPVCFPPAPGLSVWLDRALSTRHMDLPHPSLRSTNQHDYFPPLIYIYIYV